MTIASAGPSRTVLISVRLTEEESHQLAMMAEMGDMTVSEMIRSRVFTDVERRLERLEHAVFES